MIGGGGWEGGRGWDGVGGGVGLGTGRVREGFTGVLGWGAGGVGAENGVGGGGGSGVGGTEIVGICLILWLIHMVKIPSKSEVFQFSGCRTPY